jgi:2-polyprenyl-3-methyl-5-hydroxy-6-metoxy-1,4-benzoquinol methylase
MKESCEICGGADFKSVYHGPIRDGVYGATKEEADIIECTQCGVHRLAEKDCIPPDYYESGEYREHLQQSLSSDKAVYEQDDMQRFTLDVLWPNSLREKSILDVGCGVGSLLDMTRNISGSQIGVEPCGPYLESLTGRDYTVFPSLKNAANTNKSSIDWAFSVQVIEHVENPREFLEEIFCLLKPGGRALISTPNRDDVLMSLLNDEFAPFFYRSAHRWYFDHKSLTICAERAGFEVADVHFVHRYGMSNTLHWLRDNKPKGQQQIEGIDPMADHFWKGYLEKNKQSDTIYIELMVPDND